MNLLIYLIVHERPLSLGCSNIMARLKHFGTIHGISRISERELPLVARAVFAANSRTSEFLDAEELEDLRNLLTPQMI